MTERIVITEAMADKMLEALENPREPTPELKEAIRQRQRFLDNGGKITEIDLPDTLQ